MRTQSNILTPELLHKINAWWRAADYLSVSHMLLVQLVRTDVERGYINFGKLV